ncbi:isoprenyl transferase [Carboxydothermus hydrogenoformans]|uniref:Isoprenyl transferase n=1 Tax=Carboxydothermus hydrogenoformans (strain ATCC BAA-161 / DSM 6008 / Z-2901) TaxID=246194 RepID=Q3AB83_CARHZ|nr:isoprenyl transferase [Carboxydothermus hydrogenoformans]ABB14672.1 undecaprenyl diphosphate synthase [Carboxydothermus hydrogenoformans Z-2901]
MDFSIFRKKNNQIDISDLDFRKMPRHIAIIMDGNGRWAKKRGMPRYFGHRAGVETVRRVVKFCAKLNVPYLTLYAFSTENWRRPQEEVNVLMNLLVEYIEKETDELNREGVRLTVIGEISELPEKARIALAQGIEKTCHNSRLNLILALNYGGRREIVEAARKIAYEIKNGKLSPEQIDEKVFANYLYTKEFPDPDLLIRPSGEIRISNFLLWQIAYSEIWLTDVLWPDFSEEHLLQAIKDYQKRERRFGGVNYP